MKTNVEITKLLRNVAAALFIKGANRFRIIAYENAATSIEHLTSEVKDMWEDGKLGEIPGVGATIAGYLEELFKTGKVKHFEETFKGISPAVFTLLLVPGLGPKRAYQLTKEFNLNDEKTAVSALEKVAQQGKIAEMPGWGKKSQDVVLAAIATYKKGQIKENRMVLPYADALAQEVIQYLKKLKEIERIDLLGSLRRKVATIGDIDMAAATKSPEKVVAHFVNYPKVRKIIDQGPKGATVLLSVGKQVDLRVQHPDQYGAMLQYFTGSKYHNITLREYALKKGLSLNEHGIKNVKTGKVTPFKTEEAFYRFIGMDWIPPEMREDAGEVEASLKKKLPTLVTSKDIKGDLHIHTNYDLKSSHDTGSSSLKEILTKANSLGYDYVGISDHNPSVNMQGKQKVIDIMKRRKEFYEQEHYSWSNSNKNRVQLFIMLEVDIDPTGNLALPEEAFEYVDAVIVSIHSSMRMEKPKMTERILRALSHPKAKILGHPTARLLGERDGIEADWDKIFGFILDNKKAIEINSWPERLDLPDLLVRQAVKEGLKLVIDTDSHAAEHMMGMRYGVDVARRGWAEPKDILNTLGYNEFKKWLNWQN